MKKIKLISFKLCFLIPLVFLNGCRQLYWVSNSRPITSLTSDQLDCEYLAYKDFPPNLYKTVKPNYGAAFYNSMQSSTTNTKCHQYGNSLQCQTKHQPAPYVPEEVVVSRDANQNAREQATMRCMHEKGWRLEYRDVWP